MARVKRKPFQAIRTMKGATFGSLLCAIVLSGSAAAASLPRDVAFERKIEAQLKERDPDALESFVQATLALDRGELDRAAHGFDHIRSRDPWFVHATRRLCGVEVMRGHRDWALTLCREALASDRSPENEVALAEAILASRSPLPADDLQEAFALARDASMKEERTSFFTQLMLCECALRAGDAATLGICADRLRRVAPDEVPTHYFATIDYLGRGRLDEAERELHAARGGLPDRAYRGLQKAIDDAHPPLERWGGLVFRIFIGWLVGFGVLVGAGVALSATTLRAASHLPRQAGGQPRGIDASLRYAYRVVLWVTCAYYYVSLPLVALAVAGLGGLFVYATMAMGHVPVQLVTIVVLTVFATLWAVARSLLVRGREEDPGAKLDLGDHPRLLAVLEEVASRIGTRPVDSVYITPGAEVSVLERGGLIKQLRGQSERCLVLGAAVLDGLRVRELKSILAHEYGHFHNEDTAGGGFALAVRRSLVTMALHLVRGRAASGLNPAWWFVRGFHSVFLRISHGASRLQEILADRWAAVAYGSEAFARGLSHVVDRSVRFDARIAVALDEIVPDERPPANLYSFGPKAALDGDQIEAAVAKAMGGPPSPYDSHPPALDRIAWVARIAASYPHVTEQDREDAWSLLTSREAIEQRMTREIWRRLAMRGIRVASEP